MSDYPLQTVLIGLGSNVQPERYIARAIMLLRDTFTEVAISTLYRTRPLKGRNQAAYINGVAAAATRLAVGDVRTRLAAIEDACHRQRDPNDPYAERTLDLDLLAYGSCVNTMKDLPAGDLIERDFCLLPAAELLPAWVHPVLGKPLSELAAERFPHPPNILAEVPVDQLEMVENNP